MRHYRGLVFVLVVWSCKTAQVAQVDETYEEDLSVNRLEVQFQPVEQEETNEQKVVQEPVLLSNHITAEIDSINTLIVEQNRARNSREGFTIQVYVGNNRDMARSAHSALEKYYPELEPAISYRQPNYRVKAGAFYNRLEATRIYNEIKTSFPKAILLPERQALIKGDE